MTTPGFMFIYSKKTFCNLLLSHKQDINKPSVTLLSVQNFTFKYCSSLLLPEFFSDSFSISKIFFFCNLSNSSNLSKTGDQPVLEVFLSHLLSFFASITVNLQRPHSQLEKKKYSGGHI